MKYSTRVKMVRNIHITKNLRARLYSLGLYSSMPRIRTLPKYLSSLMHVLLSYQVDDSGGVADKRLTHQLRARCRY